MKGKMASLLETSQIKILPWNKLNGRFTKEVWLNQQVIIARVFLAAIKLRTTKAYKKCNYHRPPCKKKSATDI